MSSAFIQAAVILLREGLEAMLVIAALAGYLTRAGAGHRTTIRRVTIAPPRSIHARFAGRSSGSAENTPSIT